MVLLGIQNNNKTQSKLDWVDSIYVIYIYKLVEVIIAMTKDEILHLANGLYEEALLAQTYFSLIKQFNAFNSIDKYNAEINISPCFYQISYGAWLKALVMELAKMYDADKKYNTLKALQEALKKIKPEEHFCGSNLEMFLENNKQVYFPIKPSDLKIIPKQYGTLYEAFVTEETKIIHIRLPYEECEKFFNKKWCSIREQRDKLREHRNQVFAHNGFEANFDFEHANKDYPLRYSDIERLLDYAMILTRFVIGMLTDVSKPTQYSNSNDWEVTLIAVREGQIRINEQFSKDNF